MKFAFLILSLLAASLCSAVIYDSIYSGQQLSSNDQITNVPRTGNETTTRIIGEATTSQTNGSLNLVASSSMSGVGSAVVLETHFDAAGSTASVITSSNQTWAKVYSYTNTVSLVGSYWLLTNATIAAGTVISNSYTQTASNGVTMTLFSLTNQSLAFDVGTQNYVGISSTTLAVGSVTSTNGWLVGMTATGNSHLTNDFPILAVTNAANPTLTVYYQFTGTNTPAGAFTNNLKLDAASSIMGSWISLKPAVAVTPDYPVFVDVPTGGSGVDFSDTQETFTLSSGMSAGQWAALLFSYSDTSGTISSVTGGGNTWNLATNTTSSAGNVAIYYSQLTSSMSPSDTIVVHKGSGTYGYWLGFALNFTNVTAVDVSAAASDSFSTTMNPTANVSAHTVQTGVSVSGTAQTPINSSDIPIFYQADQSGNYKAFYLGSITNAGSLNMNAVQNSAGPWAASYISFK